MDQSWDEILLYNASFGGIDVATATLKSKKFKKGDIIFWEGHVAICINSKQLIHAYGPEKKVIIMPIKKTIKRILDTASLEVRKISKIKF